jgi:hypothetical protein
VAAPVPPGRSRRLKAAAAIRHRGGTRPSRAVRRGGGAAPRAAFSLGRPDRLDPVPPPRDTRRREDSARAAAPGGPSPGGFGGGAQGLRALRGREAERALDHRRARRAVRAVPEARQIGAGTPVPHRRRPQPALGRREVLRSRERPLVPGAAAPGDRAKGRAVRAVRRQREPIQERLADADLRCARHQARSLQAVFAPLNRPIICQ